jgi:hypothetical protein
VPWIVLRTQPLRTPSFNYFRGQKLLSSGVIDGLNNKAKVTMRESYGLSIYAPSNALYHSLAKLGRETTSNRSIKPSRRFLAKHPVT